MSFYTWLNRLQSKMRRSGRKPSRRGHTFRPSLEALEERLVLTERIWSGGDPFFNNWNAILNWANGAAFPFVPPVLDFDSVRFPADASRHTNKQSIDSHFSGGIFLENVHVEGGNYDIFGLPIQFIGDITSDADSNTIETPLTFLPVVPPHTPEINVLGGTLLLTGGLTSNGQTDFDLIKAGAGTLEVTSTIGSLDGAQQFRNFVVQDGLVLLDDDGALVIDLHVEDGGTVRLRENGDHISGPGRLPVVVIDAGGRVDLNGHSEGLGDLTLNGGTITVGTGGTLVLESDVTSTASATEAVIDGTVNLTNANLSFNVANGTAANDLTLRGAVQGNVGFSKDGPGRLTLSGTTPNTYNRVTVVNEGSLKLDKSDNVESVVGGLTIGDGFGGVNADSVVLSSDEQIANNLTVRINSSGLLTLGAHTETLEGLILAGGNVASIGPGLLILRGGDVTTLAAPTAATISGRLSLANASRVFNVASSVSGTDLLVSAVIVDGGIIKSGPGTLELTAVSPTTSNTTINEGQLLVNGTLTNSLVRLNTGGILAGDGSVNGITATGGRIRPGERVGTLTSTGNVTLQSAASFQPQVIPLPGDPHDVLKVQGTVNLGGAGLAVQPLFLTSVTPSTPRVIDDGDAGFTATAGFAGGFTGGFGNDVHAAGAGTGAEQAAWTFNGLVPGSYRISATWSSSPFRTTNAPYTILNGGTPVTTVRVNQQNAPADFTSLGASWDILGVVQVTGNSLTVRLTNDCDGAVIADAILLEPHQMVIIDNDGTDAVQGTFAGLAADGTQFGVIATNGTQVQNQIYTISYHANDGNDVGLAFVTVATAAEHLQITPASINEGQKVTLTGHLTDPDIGDFLTLTIDWGDGHTEIHHPGTANFEFAHRYADNPAGQPHGAYTVHLTWFDQHNAGNSRDLSVTVNNVAPTFVLPAEVNLRPSGLLVLAGHFTDPGVNDRWTATVDYGDGSGAQPLNLNPAQHFLLQHRYERTGTYRVTVTITDDDGESGTVTLLVHVDALPPHP